MWIAKEQDSYHPGSTTTTAAPSEKKFTHKILEKMSYDECLEATDKETADMYRREREGVRKRSEAATAAKLAEETEAQESDDASW